MQKRRCQSAQLFDSVQVQVKSLTFIDKHIFIHTAAQLRIRLICICLRLSSTKSTCRRSMNCYSIVIPSIYVRIRKRWTFLLNSFDLHENRTKEKQKNSCAAMLRCFVVVVVSIWVIDANEISMTELATSRFEPFISYWINSDCLMYIYFFSEQGNWNRVGKQTK